MAGTPPVAGESVTGESVAGDSVAQESVARESVVQEPVAEGSALAHAEAVAGLVDRSISPQTLEALDRYVDLLRGAGVERGLLGPREAARIWSRHILNCAALAPMIAARSSVADVGSGAGLPGVVLALLRPDITMTLVEPLLRRAEFLGEVVNTLGLQATTTVQRLRAEEHRPGTFDVVVARAVAPLGRLAGWALPLLRPGGVLLAVKGRRARAEVAEHGDQLARLGAATVQVTELGGRFLAEPTVVVVVHRH